ncbi:phospholipase D-like domain-containing protein [Dyadobacter diqingensis]|uniref:phospholipase D-like domain-containing protein n=1 Tax=Dyadobacter diqingensis TaxID=2938121 RepID=UPI0020C1B24F|nr:phospholipase D-like domain-containing protein [Dyadobacter diqingensis]
MAKAFFGNIRDEIRSNIYQSKDSIQIAVAWFTSKELLGFLTDKVKDGCKVEIIISDHMENDRLSYTRFINGGGKVFVLQKGSGKFLHDKFAIFDNKNLMAGSYNWTISAESYNHEFVIHSDENLLLMQFQARFNKLKRIVSEFDSSLLSNRDIVQEDSKEGELLNLEAELNSIFERTITEAIKEGPLINERLIRDYIFNYGAVGGANRLMQSGTDHIQSGFKKLLAINKPQLTFEYIILQDRFQILFDEETLKNARERLHLFRSETFRI